MLKPGLYEQVINKELSDKIDDSAQLIDKRNIDKAEAPQVLAGYLSEVIEKGLSRLAGDDIEGQLGLANKIVSAVTELTGDDEFDGMSVDERAEQLLAVANMRNNADTMKRRITMTRPETSLASSSLFTGAGHEPQMMTELKKEIVSADKIDMLVSFIKWSGLVLIIDELQEFTARGGQLRVITTSYMGATDVKAVEELSKLPHTEIKVSYDTERTRLHAKSYVFYRDTGFTTAYVGSSNINSELFHWQSQSTTTPESRTGQRYINHRNLGTSVMIFVREYKSNKLGAAPYTFLGLADYVKSEGSKPMNVV